MEVIIQQYQPADKPIPKKRRVKERLCLSYITTSPSLIKGRGIKGEGYLIKHKLFLMEVSCEITLYPGVRRPQRNLEISD